MDNFSSSLSVILLSGGRGTRMQLPQPKQYLKIGGKPLVLHSFECFAAMPEVKEIVVVCNEEYRPLFRDTFHSSHCSLKFALPGVRRQDSVYNGLLEVEHHAEWVCVHDGCRPFISSDMIKSVWESAKEHGAATPGTRLKQTLKECRPDGIVIQTVDRSLYWEIQTPQIMRKPLIVEGFKKAVHDNITVTDDVSLVELLFHPVKVVESSPLNIKITTLDDLHVAERIMQAREPSLATR